QAEDGIRDRNVTGVQTCALPILSKFKIIIRSVTEGDFDYAKPNDRIKMQTLAIVGELQRTISRENREINNIKKFNSGQVVNHVRSEERRVGKECRYQLHADNY